MLLYLVALAMVLAVAVAVGLFYFALWVRPERARHVAEIEALRADRSRLRGRVAQLVAELRGRVEPGYVRPSQIPTVRPGP